MVSQLSHEFYSVWDLYCVRAGVCTSKGGARGSTFSTRAVLLLLYLYAYTYIHLLLNSFSWKAPSDMMVLITVGRVMAWNSPLIRERYLHIKQYLICILWQSIYAHIKANRWGKCIWSYTYVYMYIICTIRHDVTNTMYIHAHLKMVKDETHIYG